MGKEANPRLIPKEIQKNERETKRTDDILRIKESK